MAAMTSESDGTGDGVDDELLAGFSEQERILLERQRLKNGVVARSEVSASRAADLIEYAEMAARYDVLNRHLGAPATGLTVGELRAVCGQFDVPIPAFLRGTEAQI